MEIGGIELTKEFYNEIRKHFKGTGLFTKCKNDYLSNCGLTLYQYFYNVADISEYCDQCQRKIYEYKEGNN